MLAHPLIRIKEEEPLPARFLQRPSLIEPDVDSALEDEDLISQANFLISSEDISKK